MNTQKKKCSLKEHADINANIYCKKCEIYMCNKCEVHHSKLFENHQNFILNNDFDELCNEFCEEEEHNYSKLKYYCKTHNKLCCSECIVNIKGKGYGLHANCDIYLIEDIIEEKKKGIKENIKILEDISSKFNESFKDIKDKYENINGKKEELKLKIQKIFTNIRNALNNREDELLLNVDKAYDNSYFKEEFLKDIEKLPDKIKSSLDKYKNFFELKKDDKGIIKEIKECLEIENSISAINKINANIKKIDESKNLEITFIPEENDLNEFIEQVKNFGLIKAFSNNDFESSSIIKDDMKNIELIINWIKETINKEKIKFKLIFKMSENGTKSEDFHKTCDNQGPTLTLVKTTKNKIFGGFTPLNWKSEGDGTNDPTNQTFIFSLNLKKKYNMLKKNGYGIYCREYYGPNFGDCDFDLKKNMKLGETYANSTCNFLSNKNLELTGGKGENEKYEADELEIYKVLY